MVLRRRLVAVMGAGVALACRTAAPPGIEGALTSCVPAGTVILAGVDLRQLRASPLFQQLPPAAAALLQQLRDANYALLAFNGRDFLAIARGTFREAPPGATLIGAGLAALGAPDSVRAAAAQHRTGSTGAPELEGYAAGLAPGSQVWMAAQGAATLPLQGNAANLNRLLHETRYVTVTARVGEGLALDATAVCGTPDAARRFEESLRGLLSLAGAASVRQPSLGALLTSIPVSRDGGTVRATLSATPAATRELLRLF